MENSPATPVAPLRHPLFYAGEPGQAFGWGICNKNLLRELSQLTEVVPVTDKKAQRGAVLPGHVFTPIADHSLEPTSPVRGLFTHGYTFFENELGAEAAKNAARYDLLFAGCSWCRDRLAERGIRSELLVQGVDGSVFRPPAQPLPPKRLFTIFSGGKFEYRKGQDLVLQAVRILQERYPDIVLIAAWCNRWLPSIETMRRSPHLRYAFSGDSWQQTMAHLCEVNEIPSKRIVFLPLLQQADMLKAYLSSDLGLFPNRCEGGTNLVMMEYMACGKPVVATHATGHLDVLTEDNAYLLQKLSPLELRDANGLLEARWVEPSLEEIITSVERAYTQRQEAQEKGRRAAADMAKLSWRRSAECILSHLSAFEERKKNAGV